MDSSGLRFGTLHRLGDFIIGLGWFLVAVGVISALVTVAQSDGLPSLGSVMRAAWGSAMGLLTVAGGMAAQCLVQIEHNTRPLREERQVSTLDEADVEVVETVCDACGATHEGDQTGKACEKCGAVLS